MRVAVKRLVAFGNLDLLAAGDLASIELGPQLDRCNPRGGAVTLNAAAAKTAATSVAARVP
jgi:hypothetical protein